MLVLQEHQTFCFPPKDKCLCFLDFAESFKRIETTWRRSTPKVLFFVCGCLFCLWTNVASLCVWMKMSILPGIDASLTSKCCVSSKKTWKLTECRKRWTQHFRFLILVTWRVSVVQSRTTRESSCIGRQSRLLTHVCWLPRVSVECFQERAAGRRVAN